MYTPKGEISDALYEAMKKEDVVAKLAQAKSPDECYAIVTEAGVSISREDFESSMEIMNAYLEENQEGVLTDEDLDSVAGGKGNSKEVIELVGSAVGLVGSVVGAAAAAI